MSDISTGFNFGRARAEYSRKKKRLKLLVDEWKTEKESYLYNKELAKINSCQEVESDRNLSQYRYRELEIRIRELDVSVNKIADTLGLDKVKYYSKAKQDILDKEADFHYKDEVEESVNELKMYKGYMGHEYGE